jgi:hypothetical protein
MDDANVQPDYGPEAVVCTGRSKLKATCSMIKDRVYKPGLNHTDMLSTIFESGKGIWTDRIQGLPRGGINSLGGQCPDIAGHPAHNIHRKCFQNSRAHGEIVEMPLEHSRPQTRPLPCRCWGISYRVMCNTHKRHTGGS